MKLLFFLFAAPSALNHIGKAVVSSLVAFTLLKTPSSSDDNAVLDRPSESTHSQQYDSFSSTYDKLNGGFASNALGIDEMRRVAGDYVSGDVLEVAVGTGLQSQYYNWPKLRSFTGIDTSEGMLLEARNRIPLSAAKGNSDVLFRLQSMDTTSIEYPDDKFDTVIDTFSLCVIDDPLKALKELRRVVRPNGVVVLLENSISTNPLLARVQDATEPVITPLSKGCRWNVNIPSLAKQAGLELKQTDSVQLGTIMYGIYQKIGR